MIYGLTVGSVIVPVEAIGDVTSDPGVVPSRFEVTLEDINESLSSAAHMVT